MLIDLVILNERKGENSECERSGSLGQDGGGKQKLGWRRRQYYRQGIEDATGLGFTSTAADRKVTREHRLYLVNTLLTGKTQKLNLKNLKEKTKRLMEVGMPFTPEN